MRRLKFTLFALASLLLCSCSAYKKVPYLQGSEYLNMANVQTPLYDAHIMPKDLLTITVNTSDPDAAIPFNLTVATPITANNKISVMGEVAHPGTFTITNEKVNIMEALAMAGDMTVYGQRDKVKLIREDAQGNRQVIPLNLNDADIIVSPYYYLQQNDVVYVTPNKTKAKNASISNSTTIWFSVVGTLVALASLIVTIAK